MGFLLDYRMVKVTSEVKVLQVIEFVLHTFVSMSTSYVVDAYREPDIAVTVTV